MNNRDRHPVAATCGSPPDVILRRASTLALLSLVALSGCYNLRSSSGGAQAEFTPPRQVRTDNVALPPDYRIEIIATGLTFPTAVAFDGEGIPHVVEAGYSYGEVWTSPRLLRVATNGSVIPIATGHKNGPWTGVTYADGHFYIAEGGELHGGRILKIDERGQITVLIADLPTMGDHHTNGPATGLRIQACSVAKRCFTSTATSVSSR